jgi:hypothetical protein
MIRRRLVALAVLCVAAAVAALAAQAGPPGKWTRITDKSDRNIDQVGVARTGDGVLHVFWKRRNAPLKESIRHTPITTAGKAGASTQVLPPLRIAGDPDAVVLGDGRLRVFFPGIGDKIAEAGVIAATGSSAGKGWTREGPRVSSSASTANSSGATTTSSGESIFAYTRSFVVAFRVVDSTDPDTEIQPDKQCCDYMADLATDAKNGQTWLGYYSNAKGRFGTWAQQVLPAVGKRVLVPGSATKGQSLGVDQRVALTGRIGAPGVFFGVCQGYPVCTKALLWRAGGKALTVGQSPDVEDIHTSAGPDGRVWVAWHDGKTRQIFAVRTNKAATRVGPPVEVKPPAGTSTMWKLTGEGSLGQLDLFVSASTKGSLATWHTQVLPPLSITVKKGKPAATIVVTDAGDPIQGAKVSVAGKTLTTPASGVVKATLPSGKVTVKVTKAGYAPATASVSG